jgi:predicted DNA-binding ArsR family transcriptional regulator
MTVSETNALMAILGTNATAIARDLEEDRSAVSQVLNQLRPNPRLLRKIAKRLGELVEEKVLEIQEITALANS